MDKANIINRLTEAQRQAEEDQRHIVSQNQIVAGLEASGEESTEAKRRLHNFKGMEAIHYAEVDRLLTELDKVLKRNRIAAKTD